MPKDHPRHRRFALKKGAAAAGAAVPSVADRRLPLIPLNYLEVSNEAGEAVACVGGYLMLFTAPGPRPHSIMREAACFLALYEDLLNGSVIQGRHIEGLSADRRAEIFSLPDSSAWFGDFDENFCRWVDDAAPGIVDDSFGTEAKRSGSRSASSEGVA